MLEKVLGIIASYIVTVLFLFGAYVFSYVLDAELATKEHSGKKQRIVKLNRFKRLFMRYDRNVRDEIFLIAFINELLCFFFLTVMTSLHIMAFFFDEMFTVVIVTISVVVNLSFILYSRILESSIKRGKAKQAELTAPAAADND